jgi:soluble lytic murein transglycosylase-like protein
MFNSKAPDRLNTSGVSGFGVISPNASQFERNQISRRNEIRLDKLVREMKVDTPFSGITKYFSPQDKKKAIEQREYANTWYSSEQAKKYFRANPEMISVASKDPIGFHKAIKGYSKAAPEGGRWRGQAVAAPAKADAAPAEVSASGVKSSAPAGQVAASTSKARAYEAQGTQYDTAIQQAAAQYGVDATILKRLIASESGFNPAIVNKTSGALGLAQIMPDHINKGLVTAAQARDPATAISFAAAHLAQNLRNEGGDYRKALLKYKGALSAKGTAAMSPVVRDITSGLQWNAQQVLGAVGPQLAQSRDPATNASLALRTNAPGGGAPSGVSSGGVQLTGSAAETPAPVRIDPSKFYLANQDAVPRDMQIALQNRQELARMAGMYQRAGMGAEFTQMRLKVMELDNSLTFLQGMQGIQELALANDPRRLAAVWSQYTGVPVQLQPQTDGTYNVMVNGQVTQRGVTSNTIIDAARSSFDAEYRNAQAASASAMSMKRFESGLKIEEQAAKTLGDLTSALEQEKLKGANAAALKELEGTIKLELERQNPEAKVTMTGDGTGSAILSYKDGRVATFTPGGEIEINGQTVKTAPTVRAVGVGN